MTWQFVDKLNCFELIEEYECNQEEQLEDTEEQDGSDPESDGD